ncbi:MULTISPECIES: hypothetical protein [unclassified Pseudomonas]|uniref:hypothetical protein n=1 Tax=unclassified Pseudomonas TaxID=196821 RepID=UPI001944BEF7|nr:MULTISPECIES: hypothetical protein [unclassified Pseudomonas]MCE0916086.1 hypothetical protein [Pseudomonas sp. NMI760_13]MCP8634127.1 hypothetical protein [Pseudomonas sp. DVZ6]MCF1486442.1 hypothetical protein [Pseudomonas sp. AA27]MDD7782689.1 hypothetical protein [Pseudomonas sp. DVZ24]BCJ06142.1 hypothetical protein PRtIB026_A40810 [Pseudomonas sp. RtIB026]
MSRYRMALVRSVDPQWLLDKLTDDGRLDFAEYRLMQDIADAKLDELIRRFEGQHEFEQLRQASIRMAHLLQTSCLALRRLADNENDCSLGRQALEWQLGYMQACLHRSLASLERC